MFYRLLRYCVPGIYIATSTWGLCTICVSGKSSKSVAAAVAELDFDYQRVEAKHCDGRDMGRQLVWRDLWGGNTQASSDSLWAPYPKPHYTHTAYWSQTCHIFHPRNWNHQQLSRCNQRWPAGCEARDARWSWSKRWRGSPCHLAAAFLGLVGIWGDGNMLGCMTGIWMEHTLMYTWRSPRSWV